MSLIVLLGAVALIAARVALTDDAPGSPRTFPLWPDGTPEAKGDDPDKDVPNITLYRPRPEAATGAAVVVCPGGGYGHLAMDHEGKQVAEWLNGLGVTTAVLKYRLGPRYRHPAMIQDAGRAIRMVRARAGEWGIDPKRVAILGFSAGGHLASTAGTHFDAGQPDASDPVERQSSRPDRMILLYPVVSLEAPYTHGGSRRNLLGDTPPGDLVHSLSNETQVTSQTPPTFLAHTNEDKGVPPENSIMFVLALRKAGVPVEYHLFEKGRHGLGLGGNEPAFAAWPGLCATWLKGQGFLTK
jgi:acetyl esterase/lipase